MDAAMASPFPAIRAVVGGLRARLSLKSQTVGILIVIQSCGYCRVMFPGLSPNNTKNH